MQWRKLSLSWNRTSLAWATRFLCGKVHQQPQLACPRTTRQLIRECARAASLTDGQKLHAHVLKAGLGLSSETFIHNALLHMYATCGDVSSARQVFEQIAHTHKDVVDWTTLISCYARRGLPERALRLFVTMRNEDKHPDEVTMLSIFNVCAQLRDDLAGSRVHVFMIKTGLPFTVTAQNAAMDMYAKCGRMDGARQMLREIRHRNVVSWTIFLTGVVKWEGVSTGRKFFDKMIERNEFTWTVMIVGYVEGGFSKEAMSLLAQMLHSGLCTSSVLNHVSLCSILSACSQSGDLTLGRWVHAYSMKRMETDQHLHLMVGTSLVDMYSKCGRIDSACLVFERMQRRNVVAWNAMLSGLAMHGRGHDALHRFSDMMVEGIKPDDITFVGMLSACSHSGLVDQGRECFFALEPVYGITPKIEHYACVVDLLGRAGRMEEAEAMVREMPIPPNEVVLGSLLASCSLHGKLQLGDRLLRELVEKEPLNTEYHVLLSNMFASSGRHDESDSIREGLKKRGVQKVPGISFIHVNGQVHQFSAGDKSHPQTKEIYQSLEQMKQRLKSAGYLPNTLSQIGFFRVDGEGQEEKEHVLWCHSERLAVAFGLISTSPGLPLRIFKNLRICQDCHSAIKLISDIFEREIIVRDRNRFHCFKQGSCSCSGYW